MVNGDADNTGSTPAMTSNKRPRAFAPRGKKSAAVGGAGGSNELQTKNAAAGVRPSKPSRRKSCEHPSCPKQPAFSYNGSGVRFCAQHRLEGMVNVRNRRCEGAGCTKEPYFGESGGKARFCATHKPDDRMVDVRHRRCDFDSCKKQPNYGYEGQRACYCSAHKLPTMVDVKHRRCAQDRCRGYSSFAFPGSREKFCAEHRLEGMLPSGRGRSAAAVAAAANSSSNRITTVIPSTEATRAATTTATLKPAVVQVGGRRKKSPLSDAVIPRHQWDQQQQPSGGGGGGAGQGRKKDSAGGKDCDKRTGEVSRDCGHKRRCRCGVGEKKSLSSYQARSSEDNTVAAVAAGLSAEDSSSFRNGSISDDDSVRRRLPIEPEDFEITVEGAAACAVTKSAIGTRQKKRKKPHHDGHHEQQQQEHSPQMDSVTSPASRSSSSLPSSPTLSQQHEIPHPSPQGRSSAEIRRSMSFRPTDGGMLLPAGEQWSTSGGGAGGGGELAEQQHIHGAAAAPDQAQFPLPKPINSTPWGTKLPCDMPSDPAASATLGRGAAAAAEVVAATTVVPAALQQQQYHNHHHRHHHLHYNHCSSLPRYRDNAGASHFEKTIVGPRYYEMPFARYADPERYDALGPIASCSSSSSNINSYGNLMQSTTTGGGGVPAAETRGGGYPAARPPRFSTSSGCGGAGGGPNRGCVGGGTANNGEVAASMLEARAPAKGQQRETAGAWVKEEGCVGRKLPGVFGMMVGSLPLGNIKAYSGGGVGIGGAIGVCDDRSRSSGWAFQKGFGSARRSPWSSLPIECGDDNLTHGGGSGGGGCHEEENRRANGDRSQKRPSSASPADEGRSISHGPHGVVMDAGGETGVLEKKHERSVVTLNDGGPKKRLVTYDRGFGTLERLDLDISFKKLA